MKISNIGFCSFCDGFSETYKNNFSYEGKKALYDYLIEYEDSTNTEIEMDIVAFCCEFNEFENIEEYMGEYDYTTKIKKEDYQNDEDFKKAVFEYIEEKTTLIKIPNSDGFIIQTY
jgi:hypothetical protein